MLRVVQPSQTSFHFHFCSLGLILSLGFMAGKCSAADTKQAALPPPPPAMPQSRGTGKTPGKDAPSRFEELADTVGEGGAFQFLEYCAVPGVAAWAMVRERELPSLKEFPSMLIRALGSPGTKDHQVALIFLQCHAISVRQCAFRNGKEDLEAALRRSLAPQTEAIEAALFKALDEGDAENRLKAAGVVLALQPQNARANSILEQVTRQQNSGQLSGCCRMIGLLHLTTPGAMNVLIRGLGQKDREVREEAANAVCVIGPEAKPAIPVLVALFQSGEALQGSIHPPFAISFGRSGNLALMTLAEIGPEAHPAVPVIRRLLPKASDEEKYALLACLANIGPGAKKGADEARRLMQTDHGPFKAPEREFLIWFHTEHGDVPLMAACALVNMVPGDDEAVAMITRALEAKDKKTRNRALQVCNEIGPRSGAIVRPLVRLLADDEEEIRIQAMLSLGRIGKEAAPAIPLLEQLLMKEDDHQKHTFRSLEAAGYALQCIGKASVQALIRATAKRSGGRRHAIYALGGLGRDARPAVERLAVIVADKKDRARQDAAYALGRLGKVARPARPALLASRRDNHVFLAIEWALMEITE
jgi:HEAT repeat protein